MATKQSREDFRKKKELEEARKAGTAPAEVDEDGKDINPHIPQYISEAPWYLKYEQATLTHQRQDEEKIEKTTPLDEFVRIKKGVKKDSKASKKFRKGACTNCGAMSHTAKSCVERPRKKGAKFTKKDIAKDEHVPDQAYNSYAEKHDRWRGYNPAQYQTVIKEYAKVDEEKRKMREKELREEKFNENVTKKKKKDKTDADDTDSSDSDDEEEDEAKYADKAGMIAKFDAKNRVSVRNLRIREDRAKYLINLDPSSAHYDAKTRTMRADPFKGTDKEGSSEFKGENFIRYNDDTHEINKRQMFAWDVSNKGDELHLQADPTLAEMMHKQHREKKETFKTTQRGSVLDKYGGQEYLKAPPKELLMAQSEHYIEYSKGGRVIKGQEIAKVRSKYEEDQFPGNHKSIWGSFWRNGRWGFACCHSHVKESYCTGEAGKEAARASAASALMMSTQEVSAAEQAESAAAEMSMVEQHQAKMAADAESAAASEEGGGRSKSKKKRKQSESEDAAADEKERVRKVKRFMEQQDAADAEATLLLTMDERDRKYGASMGSVEKPSEEEMEAWRLRQGREDDPLKHMLSGPGFL